MSNRQNPPRFSLVIPAFNEAGYLPRLLDSVDAARELAPGGAVSVEVIVADNASTDNTATIAAARGCQVVGIAKRMIAAVRNAGAAIARGEILCFVDADSQVHPETFIAIHEALASGRVVAGATGVRLERMSVGIALTYAVMIPMVWLTGMDTGVVFCRRSDFEAIGGYPEDRLFGEDVIFLLRLRRLGRRRGQRLCRLRRFKALTSCRKWDEHGEWHYFGIIARGLPGLLGVTDPRRFAERYWYRPRR